MASQSWQPELRLLHTVSASAAALEGVLVASTSSEESEVPTGPSSSTPSQAKASLRVIKGSCSVLHSACTVACRSISEKVKILQRSRSTEDASAVASFAPGSGKGSKAHEVGSSVNSSAEHQVPGADSGRFTPKGKRRGVQVAKSDSDGDLKLAQGNVADVGLTQVVQVSEKATQTEVEADVRRSERLRGKSERGFLDDKISGLDNEELHLRKELMRDAWKDYDMAHILSLPQYLKIAGLVCEGYLREGPPTGPWYEKKRVWRVWEPFVKEAELEKFGTDPR